MSNTFVYKYGTQDLGLDVHSLHRLQIIDIQINQQQHSSSYI
jgi:hypothetical protein